MSHIGRIDPRGTQPRTAWRFFPWYVVAAMGVVMLVNGVMTWLAVSTFPGLATAHGFSNSNSYDDVLAAAQRQAGLGWTVTAAFDGARPVVTLAGPGGAALAGALLTATAERPLGEKAPTELVFRSTAPGRYVADTVLAPGAWDVDVSVTAEGHEYHTVRRLVAP